jgi:hypothetical protein
MSRRANDLLRRAPDDVAFEQLARCVSSGMDPLRAVSLQVGCVDGKSKAKVHQSELSPGAPFANQEGRCDFVNKPARTAATAARANLNCLPRRAQRLVRSSNFLPGSGRETTFRIRQPILESTDSIECHWQRSIRSLDECCVCERRARPTSSKSPGE